MSRNNAGTYTLPTGNPVVSGSVISSAWANDTMNDIATALTDSLSRSGKGGMSAAFRSIDGTVSVPGISFNDETGTGFYRAASSDVRLALQGTELLKFTSLGLTMTSSTAYYPQITLKNTAADATATYYTMDKNRNGSIVQSGDGLGAVVWRGFDGTNFLQAAAIIGYVNGTPGTNDMPGSLGFFTTADGDSSPTRRVYIDAAGDVTLDHINSNTSATAANVYVDANGKLYRATGSSSFPAGTAMLFVQTAAPTGWTKSTTHDNKALRVVSGTAGSGGSVAFTTAFANGSAGATTLSTSQLPSHRHSLTGGTLNDGVVQNIGGPLYSTSYSNVSFPSAVGLTGGGDSHTHSLSLAVQYVDVIIATKD